MSADAGREACREWRGDLAMRSIGRVDPARAAALQAHLDGCPFCRDELADLAAVARSLESVDPAHVVASPETPRELSGRVVGAVRQASEKAGRQRRIRALLAAAALVAVLLGAGAWAWTGRGDGREAGQVIALTGADGATGHAALSARPWGTEVDLSVAGLDQGEVYWLWLTGDDGKRVSAGTVTGTGQPMDVVLASALPAGDARRIWMTDADDAIVLDAPVPAA